VNTSALWTKIGQLAFGHHVNIWAILWPIENVDDVMCHIMDDRKYGAKTVNKEIIYCEISSLFNSLH